MIPKWHKKVSLNSVLKFYFRFKLSDFFDVQDDKTMDWTIIIISAVASVIFLLILINALIWFIFSIK